MEKLTFYNFLGKKWDCENVVKITRYVDGIVSDENKLEIKRGLFKCHQTGEQLQIDEKTFLKLQPVKLPEVC